MAIRPSAFLLTAILLGLAGHSLLQQVVRAQPATTPYTMSQTTENWDIGLLLYRDDAIIGSYSDGSFATSVQGETHRLDGKSTPFRRRHIYDLRIGRYGASVTLMPDVRSKVIRPLSPHEKRLESVMDPSTCSRDAVDEGQKILGFRVVKIDHVQKRHDGFTATTTSLRAPALGCAQLQVDGRYVTAAGRVSEVKLRTTAIQLGEPAEWLRDVPADYAEHTPSEQMRALSLRDGNLELPEHLRKTAITFDERFREALKHK